jgi:hypothetical protein
MSALVPLQYPTNGEAASSSRSTGEVPRRLRGDLPEENGRDGGDAAAVAEPAFSEPTGRRVEDRPSWAVVATGDKAAGHDVVRSMAERAARRSPTSRAPT